MKKIFILMVNLILALSLVMGSGANGEAETASPADNLKIGDYIILGKYNGEPILWRYMADDENGKLIVTDKILCEKFFGSTNNWEDSFIRAWLNSSASEDETQWDFNEIKDYITDSYKNEKGFLHESNFTKAEKSVMKPVTQWTMLSPESINLSENNIFEAYSGIKAHIPGSPKDGGGDVFYEISELPEIYHGAAHKVTDRVFLMDEMQIYQIYCNLGLDAICAKGFYDSIGLYSATYYLRTPESVGDQNCTAVSTYGNYTAIWSYYNYGIRPAFYLEENNMIILSGNGTEEDPYVVNGKDTSENNSQENQENQENQEPNNSEEQEQTEKPSVITVFYNGSEISFDQLPYKENDRVLVPMRAIFETLGAEVEWNEAEQSITAVRGTDVIKMQIGSVTIIKNEEVIESDVAPRLIGERTFVPLRVIAESLDTNVEWVEEENKVLITTE